MKPSPSALGFLLTSCFSGSAVAFTPSSLRFATVPNKINEHKTYRPVIGCSPTAGGMNSSTSLFMVGGGMIERPTGDGDESSGNSDDSDDAEERGAKASKYSSSGMSLGAEEERLLAKLGGVENIDPWNPNPYIKPRPGKYGWSDTNVSATESLPVDLKQDMTSSERDENLQTIRRLRQDDIPLLTRTGDNLGAAEACRDADAREAADPWYGLNERLGDAIKYGTEDVDTLRNLIEQVGGPPPLLAKYAAHPRGYVIRSEIIGMNLSNQRLEKMIERRSSGLDSEENEARRQEALRKQMKNLENPTSYEDEVAEIRELNRQRQEEYYRGIMEREAGGGYAKYFEDEKKDYDKKREELLKKLGGDEPEYSELTGEFLDGTMKNFVADLKRINNLFDDDDDDDEGGLLLDEGGDYGDEKFAENPMSKAAQARAEAMKNDGSGRPRLPGDADVTKGELDADVEINEASSATTGPLTVEVSSAYNTENSDPPMRKHCFQYTVRITNNSDTDTVQLLSRRFEIQTVGSSMKDVVQGEGVTGRQPVLQPGEVFEYTSTAPLSVRPIGTTEIAARMSGEYRYCILQDGQDKATDEQINKGQGEAGAELATFHFVFPEEQRVKPVRPSDDDDDDDEEDASVKTTTVASKAAAPASAPPAATDAAATPSPASSLPGEPDMTSGNISTATPPNDSSDTLTSDVRVVVTSTYRPERSDATLDKHCFAYNVRITNESPNGQSIQLVSRRFEIQTVGSSNKDVVQGPGVTGRQPVLKPGESFEYTSTAPLSVRPMLDKTQVVARMSGEYNFVLLGDDGKTPVSSTPMKAELGSFHFILPE
ncbi:hypothetical protein ACHAWT_009830 [Skeletonema menzelii]